MSGTRFKLYPQPNFLANFEEPETVFVSSPAGSIGLGPSDEHMYTIYPVGKATTYGIDPNPSPQQRNNIFLPPWTGGALPPAEPDAEGHFDHLQPGTPQFEMAHLFGTVRFVLDIWEGYFGRRLDWHFARDYERMELTIHPALDDAHTGYGFVEVGGYRKNGIYRPFSLNFDIIAHEVGHTLIFSAVGIPDPELVNAEYWGFHESAADLVALVSSLHFNSVVDDLLVRTRGNLYTFNALNRMAELSANEQIRIAANDVRLSQFARGWNEEHLLSQPLTGAFFDIFVDIFHELLLDQMLIAPDVEDLSDRLLATPAYATVMQAHFDRAFEHNPEGFKETLLLARDTLGTYLADTWSQLDAHYLDYVEVAATFEAVDRKISGGRFRRLIKGNFDMRDIGHVRVGPQLAPLGRNSHVGSVRTLVPARR